MEYCTVAFISNQISVKLRLIVTWSLHEPLASGYSNIVIMCFVPHGPAFSTVINSPLRQDCLFIVHSDRSSAPSEVQTGLKTSSGQVGQMHSAEPSLTLHPTLYGELHPMVLHGSVLESR